MNTLVVLQAQHDADQDAMLAKRRRDAQERERVTRLTLDRQVRLYTDPGSMDMPQTMNVLCWAQHSKHILVCQVHCMAE